MLWNLHLPAVIRREFSSMTNELREAELSERALLWSILAILPFMLQSRRHSLTFIVRKISIRRPRLYAADGAMPPMQAKPRPVAGKMIANGGNTAGRCRQAARARGGGKGKGAAKEAKESLKLPADGPITFTFDPSAGHLFSMK